MAVLRSTPKSSDSNQGGEVIVGVFELYSDVTPFLGRIKVAAKAFAALTADNQQRIEEQSRDNQSRADGSSRNFLIIVCSLLALLYGVSSG